MKTKYKKEYKKQRKSWLEKDENKPTVVQKCKVEFASIDAVYQSWI